MKRILAAFLIIVFALFGSALSEVLVDGGVALNEEMVLVEYEHEYYSADEVALYLHAFRVLPVNFINKALAQYYGWKAGEDLWAYVYGAAIGGDVFGNYEGLLPDAENRVWYECDVNYEGGHRDEERIVFSSDGLIYLTLDHYETFELLYDGWYADGVYGEVYLNENS